jgi:peptidyl-prolyl cis-trans isomerase SurA
MKQLYGQFIEKKVSDREEVKLIRDNPDYRMLLNEYREGILLFDIMEKEVWSKASEDTLGQRKYYQTHLDKFKAGNRVEARIFATADRTFRDEISRKISVGDSIKDVDVKKFKSVTNWKNYERSESQAVDQVNWVPGLQQAEVNGTFYLVEIRKLVLPGTKSLEDARAGVISGYQDTLEKEWLNRLRKNYPVRINKKGKIAVIAALKK